MPAYTHIRMPEPHILEMKSHRRYIVVYKSERSLNAVTYVQLGVHSILFSILGRSIVRIGVARPADMLGFEISGTHF